MKASSTFISTLKEAPADAEIVSHRLMMRAGFIKRLGAGIYSYMPLGLRVIRKVEAIIRDEMVKAGSVELLMPVVQPAELWQESGRFQAYGPELMRVKDRHDRDFVIQPTSEEVITDIARQELRSYKQLPRSFFHIQTKFRDERRPRFGLMRGREFTMKDAYSFDRDQAGALKSYERMVAAYNAIFTRFGLQYRAVAADTGAIGGDASQEFQVIADTGEDAIVYCPTSDYAANIELAEGLPLLSERAAPSQGLAMTPTPGKATCEDVAALLGISLSSTVKSLVLATDPEDLAGDKGAMGDDGEVARTTLWLLLIRGDHSLNEVKVGKLPGFKDGFRFATAAEIEDHFGCRPGYLGPVKTRKPVKVVADRTVSRMADFVCGANKADVHMTGVNWGRDLPEPDLVADIRNVVAGEPSPDGKGVLAIQRGIEVGHVFYLGTKKYSLPMQANFLDENGKPRPFEMGCYGIGVTRILGAAVEQNHDERGMIWPASIAPFAVVICPIGYERSAEVKAAAEQLHDELAAAGMDVVLDDRGERPGAMFADWELIGVPLRVVISDRGLKAGTVELQGRRETEATSAPLVEAATLVKARLGT
ncbi:MAG TPA: proline--tRNA ligase [Rubrivivax sp.]|nr:proline--tRNA ligase [Rubrivivax sp.]